MLTPARSLVHHGTDRPVRHSAALSAALFSGRAAGERPLPHCRVGGPTPHEYAETTSELELALVSTEGKLEVTRVRGGNGKMSTPKRAPAANESLKGRTDRRRKNSLDAKMQLGKLKKANRRLRDE